MNNNPEIPQQDTDKPHIDYAVPVPEPTPEIPVFKFKKWLLSFSEVFDAFRVVPRIVLIAYSILIYQLYMWYTSISTQVQEKCDAILIKMLLEHGETVEFAQTVACTVVDSVGGPTTAQTAFVTTIIGLATPLFALYANSGKKAGKE